jgi:ankyrin repeat protein
MHAARNGKIEMVKDLLNVPGIDLNVIDKYSKSALMYAEEESHTEIVRMLQNAVQAGTGC